MKGSTADYQAENRISELEERSFKTIKSEEQKGKTELKKLKRSTGDRDQDHPQGKDMQKSKLAV